MNDFFLFLGKFFKHGTTIASLAPSSRWLSRTTVRNVPWDRARILVELGAGTGPIPRVLAEKAPPDFGGIFREKKKKKKKKKENERKKKKNKIHKEK